MANLHFHRMAAFDEQGDSNSQESFPGSEGSSEHQEQERTCWICFASEGENHRALWVQPCQCRGTTKWVHQSCLYRWIDEKQKGNIRRIVVCQQCLMEYMIVFPPMGHLATVLDFTHGLVRRFSPYMVASVFFGSIYWSASTFGAITVVQVMGNQRGFALIENANSLVLAAGLPLIPMALVLSRFIRWEDAVLNLIRSRHNIFRKVPILSLLYRTTPEPEDTLPNTDNSSASPPIGMDPLQIARVFAGALLLPTFATIFGGIFFRGVDDSLHRNLLGGATFIAVKGLLNIYLRQKLFLRRRHRLIFDYTEDNLRLYSGNEPDGDQGAAERESRQNAGFDNDNDSTTDTDSYDTDTDDDFNIDDLNIDSDSESDLEYYRRIYQDSWRTLSRQN
ncbi:E3 ubiquitin-protein ligase MARCHF5 [Drosophila obscura]|uniref:E3 ubiquitin-protein ligase MARCHF5 n=1 Tax=Drosophila obscura TaxID=7282 RepID=UPI001BB14022|nr:E3 ubiquitin-protein ligase MARCHF5 [Drosophila obscura]XP_022208760.2 E3 ubiquitin-protein ligase MARCHF5 [Drosophila obscura]